jgi:hypothetical protein
VAGGSDVTLDGCAVKNMSGSGITVGDMTVEGFALVEHWAEHGAFPPYEPGAEQNGLRHAVKNCLILNMGMDGALVNVGKVSSRESGHFLFENNLVLNTGLINNWGGVSANGVGVSLIRNTVAFAPALGMVINGPDSVAAFNEIFDVASDPAQNDTSAFGIHHGQIAWGLRVHDNYVHDIQRSPVREWETYWEDSTPDRLALYVDQSAPGAEICRNVIKNAPIGMCMPDSPIFPSTYADNIIVDASIPVQPYVLSDLGYLSGVAREEALAWGEGWYSAGIFSSGIYKTAWRDVYPEFYDFYEYYLHEKADMTQPMSPVYNNTIVNINTPLAVTDPHGASGLLPPDDQVTPDPAYGRYGNNRYLSYDPGFADYASGDVQLSKEAADRLGVEWIDMSKIGSTRHFYPQSPLVSVSGTVASYNPSAPTVIVLMKDGKEVQRITIPASPSH